MGDAICLSPVNILSENLGQIALERIAILYPTTLFLLSTITSSSVQQEYQVEVNFIIIYLFDKCLILESFYIKSNNY
jgi:hypothetical protein